MAQFNRSHPYGEDQEPYWREHDTSLRHEANPQPPPYHPPHLRIDPDWDESHWFNGERYYLGHRYYRRRFWDSVKTLFHFFKKDKLYPDSVVADEVCDALAHEPEVDVHDIEVTVKDGHVTLAGRASDHWMRQQAEDAIYFLPGVQGVTNNITVKVA